MSKTYGQYGPTLKVMPALIGKAAVKPSEATLVKVDEELFLIVMLFNAR